MKFVLVFVSLLFAGYLSKAQTEIKGTIKNANSGELLGGVTLVLVGAEVRQQSEPNGSFGILLYDRDTLLVSYMGYSEIRVAVHSGMPPLNLEMHPMHNQLQEVHVNTGYYQVPKERATGSFVHVDNSLLNRAMGSNILQRLEGIAPGVQFVNAGGTNAADIRVRGLSTIESDETPLIVLDNFPYEGSIGNIDPNNIESVTVLKDAAAASIWGARAGNGVIVITSKHPRQHGRVRIALNSNFNFGERPDLTYGKDWLPSETVMEIEKHRYELGHYTFEDNQTTDLYVDYLRQHEDGLLTDGQLHGLEQALREIDTRKEAMGHLYRPGGFQQYALNFSGAGERYGYVINAGYHGSMGNLVGNEGRRMNLGVRNRFNPSKYLDIGMGIEYVGQRSVNDGIAFSDLSQGGRVSPYLRLLDQNGTAMAVPRANLRPYFVSLAEANGLLDWSYRPLDERDARTNSSYGQEFRLNGDLSAKPWKGLAIKAAYQYINGKGRSESHYLKDSYYVRNLVNTFTQSNGARILPSNGILRTGNPEERFSHFARGQADYHVEVNGRHSIHALAGMEIRHSQTEVFPASVLYNYEADYLTGTNQYNFDLPYVTLPVGTPQRIPGASATHRLYTNRDLSYFANTSYEYSRKYMVSGSMRWDGSNLFGVKTNRKGVPLWSVGGSWEMSGEAFYSLESVMPYLRIRTTYGVSGNVNKSVTHYPTVRYGTSFIGLTAATLVSVGNPSLRWEKVNVWNAAVDWRLAGNRLTGTVERFRKKGNDLIGNDYMDPTTGISENYKINYADIQTVGWEVQLNSQNLQGGFSWNTTFLSSWVKNEVTNYRTNEGAALYEYFGTAPPPLVGRSRDAVYAIPWNGLSPETGLPVIYMDGAQSTDYQTYYQQYLEKDMLQVAGVNVPTWYGSLLNTFSWNGFEASVMLTWKSGYVFRRESMAPLAEYSENYHQDYFRRWQRGGDERYTHVPRHIPQEESGEHTGVAAIYNYSEALMTDGNHIRVQDVSFGYRLPSQLLTAWPIRGIRVYGYARNLGILWKSNREGIDPDFVSVQYRAPRTYSIGVQLDF